MTERNASMEDFAPEVREPEAAEKKRATKQVTGGGVGDFEAMSVHEISQLAQPLNLPNHLLREHELGPYQTAYNTYTSPLRSTMRAMGRMKDLSLTGAPFKPSQMSPALTKRFRKLKLFEGNGENKDGAAQTAMDVWSTAQTSLQIGAEGMYGQQLELRAAMANFHGVQAMLTQRKKEAERDGLFGEVLKIEHTAEIAARIVEVGAEAVMGAAEIDEALDAGAEFDESAETEPDAESWSSKEQKVGEGMAKAASGISKGRAVLKEVNKYATNGKSIEMRDIFIIVQGDAKRYEKLKSDIDKLSETIGILGWSVEQQKVNDAKLRLDGLTIRLATSKKEQRATRKSTRDAAASFAHNNGAGKEGMLAMYAAEAAQELDTFGTLANDQLRNYVWPLIGAAAGFVGAKVNDGWFEAENLIAEGDTLVKNIKQVDRTNDYFKEHLPEWQDNAQKWRAFLEVRTHKQLLNGESALDEESDAG
jgi:hypothetical protein